MENRLEISRRAAGPRRVMICVHVGGLTVEGDRTRDVADLKAGASMKEPLYRCRRAPPCRRLDPLAWTHRVSRHHPGPSPPRVIVGPRRAAMRLGADLDRHRIQICAEQVEARPRRRSREPHGLRTPAARQDQPSSRRRQQQRPAPQAGSQIGETLVIAPPSGVSHASYQRVGHPCRRVEDATLAAPRALAIQLQAPPASPRSKTRPGSPTRRPAPAPTLPSCPRGARGVTSSHAPTGDLGARLEDQRRGHLDVTVSEETEPRTERADAAVVSVCRRQHRAGAGDRLAKRAGEQPHRDALMEPHVEEGSMDAPLAPPTEATSASTSGSTSRRPLALETASRRSS